MGALVKSTDVRRIDLEGGEWVEIRSRWPHGLVNKIRELRDKPEAILMMAITGWHIDDGKGGNLELTEENLKLLDITVTNRIAEEMQKTIPLVSKAAVTSTPESGQ